MPYTIQTKDGIVLKNIPDEIDPNSNELKARVQKIRNEQSVKTEVSKMREGSALRRGFRGAGASLQNAALGIKDVFTDLSPEEQLTAAANRQFLEEDTAGKVGGFAADVASFAIPGGAATKGLTMLPRIGRVIAANPLKTAVATDAALSAAYSTEDKGEAALAGALGSAAGQGIVRGAGRLLGGVVRPSAEARTLMQKGIQPTIGQGADQGTMSGRLIRRGEEIAESVPIAGTFVSRARQRAADELGETAMQRAVPPGGTAVGGPSRESFQALRSQFDKAYKVLDPLTFTPDKQFSQDLLAIINDPDNFASRSQINRVLAFVNKNFDKKFQSSEQDTAFISGKALKEFESKIGKRIRDLARSMNPEDAAERRILTQVDEALTQYRNRQLPPSIAQDLRETDRAYANYKRLLRAGSYVGADEGAFTPAMLTRSVKAMARNPDQYARGQALMQDLTDPASILRGRTPNSGTVDRAALLGLGAGTLINPVGTLTGAAAGAAGTAGLYARPVQRFMLGGYNYQKALEEALRRQARLAGSVGAAAVSE